MSSESERATAPSSMPKQARVSARRTPFYFRLYDVAEYSVEEFDQLKNYIVCFGRNPAGERVAVFVQNVPHELYLAVPEETTDATRLELENFLNRELLRKNRFADVCRYTDCPRCYPQNSTTNSEDLSQMNNGEEEFDEFGPDAEAVQEALAILEADAEEVAHSNGSTKRSKRPQTAILSEPCKESRKRDVRPVVSSTFVRRRGFIGYEKDTRKFIRFVLSGAFYARDAEMALLKKTSKGLCASLGNKKGAYEVCPHGVDSFMRLADAKGFFWYECNNAAIRPKKMQHTLAKHEIVVDFKDFKELAVQPSPSSADYKAPVVSLVLDIETISDRPNGVSNPRQHPIGMIAVNLVNDLDPSKNERKVFTWGAPAPRSIAEPFADGIKTKVYSDATEAQMLMRFRAYVLKTDPDFLVGYNSNNFDLPYIFSRAKVLKEPLILDLSLFLNRPCRHMQVEKRSNQMGARKMSVIDLPGRTCFDLYPFSLSRLKLRRYRMQDVVEHLDPTLKKGDMPYGDIYKYFHGTADQRKQLLEYCLLDAALTAKILKDLSGVPTLVAQSQVFRARPIDVLEKGQLARNARLIRGWTQNEYLIPSRGLENFVSHHDKYADCELYTRLWGPGRSVHFEGGRVFEPVRGRHDYVACLDFNSLYPSIIRAHNLCHTTFMFSEEHLKRSNLDKSQVRTTVDIGSESTKGLREPETFMFVREDVRVGVLPRMLNSLLDARKRTKKLRDECEDLRVKQSLDAEQDSYKLCANSVYGLLGFRGELENLAAAASVTAYGRHYIEQARLAVEAKYGSELDFVYGDTDSIMFSATRSCGDSLDKARETAAKIADYLNTSGVYPPPMKIEFEKIFKSMLLEDKKRYAGHAFDANIGSSKGKFFARGLETVRRDFPPYVSECLKDLLARMLIERKSDDELLSFVRHACSSLLLGQVPPERLKLTAALSKPVEEYAMPARQPHVAAARQLQEQGLEVRSGDRVEYVYVVNEGRLKSDRAMPYSMFLNGGGVVDYEEYFDKLAGPFKRALFYLSEEHIGPLFDIRRYDRLGADGNVVPASVGVNEPFVPKKKRTVASKTKAVNSAESTLFNAGIIPGLATGSGLSPSPSGAALPSAIGPSRQYWAVQARWLPTIVPGAMQIHTSSRLSQGVLTPTQSPMLIRRTIVLVRRILV